MMMLRFTSQMSVILLVLLCAVRFNTIICCPERDRSLLLMFKQGVVDPSNRLSSWSTLHDCCLWEGVECDGDNNRVIYLYLSSYNNHSEYLRGEINLSSLLALELLDELDLSFNGFERISMPSISTSVVANFSNLSSLSLSNNSHLHIDNLHWLSRLPFLRSLDLSGVPLLMETNWIQLLPSLPLQELFLNDCHLTSFNVPSVKNDVNFSSLYSIDLGLNDFRYGLPNWLFNLSNHLFTLELSQCNLRGPIPDFSGFRNLEYLDLSYNKLKGPIPDWLGHLGSIHSLILSNNLIHGSIPLNLANSSSTLSYLDISFNDLSWAHPKILEHNYSILDLSHNSISGDISKLLLTSKLTDMSFNKFEGRLPRVSESVFILDLAQNSFSGSLFSLLCPSETEYYSLVYLDISNNFLTEELPNCWSNWANLSHIYLGSNKLFGGINPTLGSSLLNLRSLDLHDNSFYGQIPSTFKNCTSLVLLNLEGNNFSGSVPKWMPHSVSVVKLRSNQFIGDIATLLCSLSYLSLLDLANNKLSGSIPHCLHNLTLMISGPTSFLSLNNEDPHGIYNLGIFFPREIPYQLYHQGEKIPYQLYHQGEKIPYQRYHQGKQIPYQPYRSSVHTKRQELRYDKYLGLVRSIDLSANELSGEIPAQLSILNKLQSLNLSYNYLIGDIPAQIGEMIDLESLDFSHNSLHGNIPQSMSSLSFLSVLNLSYNHFNGQIPLGTQLQSFDAWSYIENPELCGPPLQKNCTIHKKIDNTEQDEGNNDGAFLMSMYLGMGVGFSVGFWIVCGSLFLNRAWRHTYFRFFDGVIDQIYVIVARKI